MKDYIILLLQAIRIYVMITKLGEFRNLSPAIQYSILPRYTEEFLLEDRQFRRAYIGLFFYGFLSNILAVMYLYYKWDQYAFYRHHIRKHVEKLAFWRRWTQGGREKGGGEIMHIKVTDGVDPYSITGSVASVDGSQVHMNPVMQVR